MVQWRLYYGDGSTYSNEEGLPEDAPSTGVMCVAWFDDDQRRRLAHAADYYWYDEGRWCGSDLFGLWDYLARPGLKIVKFGRMVADLKFRQVMLHAMNDLPVERG